MSKTKIKTDEHGLYIRGAGYIWRADYPIGARHAYGPTVFQEGDEVSVSHSGGPLASIRRGDGTREHWYAHGSYYPSEHGPQPRDGKKLLTSDQVFRPDYKNW
jgi:hypothetical protein